MACSEVSTGSTGSQRSLGFTVLRVWVCDTCCYCFNRGKSVKPWTEEEFLGTQLRWKKKGEKKPDFIWWPFSFFGISIHSCHLVVLTHNILLPTVHSFIRERCACDSLHWILCDEWSYLLWQHSHTKEAVWIGRQCCNQTESAEIKQQILSTKSTGSKSCRSRTENVKSKRGSQMKQ